MVTKLQKGIDEFDEMIKELGDAPTKSYSTDSCYTNGEFLEHKVFGVGKVIKLITPDKMAVRFKDGQKILICGPVPLY